MKWALMLLLSVSPSFLVAQDTSDPVTSGPTEEARARAQAALERAQKMREDLARKAEVILRDSARRGNDATLKR
jgi:hypothetical protein